MNNQDTAFIRLMVEGERVSGDFSNIPYQKDSRIGTIEARKEGELIKGQWAYMQEGMNDTLEVEFRLVGNKLIQKNYTVDSRTGREILSDRSEFNIEFTKADCRQYKAWTIGQGIPGSILFKRYCCSNSC